MSVLDNYLLPQDPFPVGPFHGFHQSVKSLDGIAHRDENQKMGPP